VLKSKIQQSYQPKNTFGKIRCVPCYPSAWDLMLKIDGEIQVHSHLCVGAIQETCSPSSYRSQQLFDHRPLNFIFEQPTGMAAPSPP